MRARNRWKEALLSLAAGQSMVPFGDNGAAIRRLTQQVWALRAAEAAQGRAAQALRAPGSHGPACAPMPLHGPACALHEPRDKELA